MTDKELHRLRRDELLEILLGQQKEIDRLTAALAEAEKKLEDREIKIMNAGSIAEASLALTEVFAQAQRAADLYIENIRRRTGAAVEPEAEKTEMVSDTEPAAELPEQSMENTDPQFTLAETAESAEAQAEVPESADNTEDRELEKALTDAEETAEGEMPQEEAEEAPKGGESAV